MVLNSQLHVYVPLSVVRKVETGGWFLYRAAHHRHPRGGVCVSDGDRALLPDSCRGVAGEGQ